VFIFLHLTFVIWTLQDAKNRFSEVVERATTDGPQRVTKHGKETVVILAIRDWQKLEGNKQSIAEFFLSSPLSASELEFKRDQTVVRPVEL
jgi:antitoxin Phd